MVRINKLKIKSNAHSDLLQELSRWFDWNGFLEMIIQAFLDATCRRRDKHAETLRDYQTTALVHNTFVSKGTFKTHNDFKQYKEVTKSV